MAPTAQTEDTRDGNTIVAVVHKSEIASGGVKDGVSPGRVTLDWLRFGDNAEKWVEVDPTTGKKVTPSQAAKAADAAQEG